MHVYSSTTELMFSRKRNLGQDPSHQAPSHRDYAKGASLDMIAGSQQKAIHILKKMGQLYCDSHPPWVLCPFLAYPGEYQGRLTHPASIFVLFCDTFLGQMTHCIMDRHEEPPYGE
jgi:hypothetical protein